MSEHIWEKFAAKSPENYILTGGVDYSTKEGIQRFFDTGTKFTEETLDEVLSLLPGKNRALEIGCGVGRLTLPHAKKFNEIVAVDISSTMLACLNHNATKYDQKNIITFLPSRKWDSYPFDYAYSFLVFQHIESFDTIKDYIKRISTCLKTGGIAQLQFDTRKTDILYRIRNALPDFFVPPTQKKGIRRIRRDSNELRKVFAKNKLKILKEKSPDSEKHFFILKKVFEGYLS